MDTISDMITRIRNAQMVKKPDVLMPYSKFKHSLAKVLMDEGYVKSVDVKEEQGAFKKLSISLKYTESGEPAITGISRVSTPGQRIYSKNSEIPRALGGAGTTIVSTSKGLMSDSKARKEHVGGEVICQVW